MPHCGIGKKRCTLFDLYTHMQKKTRLKSTATIAALLSHKDFYRIAGRLYGIPASPQILLPNCEEYLPEEPAAPPVRVIMSFWCHYKDCWEWPSRPFGLLVNHSEGLKDLDHCQEVDPFHGHYLTVLQVGVILRRSGCLNGPEKLKKPSMGKGTT